MVNVLNIGKLDSNFRIEHTLHTKNHYLWIKMKTLITKRENLFFSDLSKIFLNQTNFFCATE